MPAPVVPGKGLSKVSKWATVKRISSVPGLLTEPRPNPRTPRWNGHGLAGILDVACRQSAKPPRRRRADTTESIANTERSVSSLATGAEDPAPSNTRGTMQLVKKLEKQCDRQVEKLLDLEYDAEINIMESVKLRERTQELQKQDKKEHQLCKDFATRRKKAEGELRVLLNAHANAKLDAHQNKRGWMYEIGRRDNELKQVIHAVTENDKSKLEPQAKEAADSLVTRVKSFSRVNEVTHEESALVGTLKTRCQAASQDLAEVRVRETGLNENIARNHISYTLLERDFNCNVDCLRGMHEAASKDAAQFAQYHREKDMLQENLHDGRKKQADNLQQAKQIKVNTENAKKEAQEKLYLGQLEVRRLEDVLRETKDKTMEHMAEAELLTQWEARLPYAHLNQYKMADDDYYKLADKHHKLNHQLHDMLETRKAQSEASRASNSHMTMQAW
eukprot:gnl/MRDRNA2_/MRDRNA2_93565_c0_seq1.p1 gnl/MRDRNA2_/MRDRNA2_93565_c0~~gnl/MRDRNA2_/MRDRNA2_93565_c0_seq1.p1  ORF type:complete len:447 (+),score=98.49 gnl/MRDRNA2_/MRDRNA2_93565_c0_seq1:88-1428(+)